MRSLSRLRARNVTDARDFDPALARDLLDRRKVQESVERRQHHVVRVGGPEALRENIADSGAFHDRAHSSAGNDPGARCGGLHENLAGAVRPDDLVRDRPAGHRNRHHLPLGRIDGLANRFGDLVRLASGEADLPLAIADGDERIEREAPAALHDLGDTVERDDVLDQIALLASAIPPPPTPVAPATTFAATTTAAARASALTTATATAAARAAP